MFESQQRQLQQQQQLRPNVVSSNVVRDDVIGSNDVRKSVKRELEDEDCGDTIIDLSRFNDFQFR